MWKVPWQRVEEGCTRGVASAQKTTHYCCIWIYSLTIYIYISLNYPTHWLYSKIVYCNLSLLCFLLGTLPPAMSAEAAVLSQGNVHAIVPHWVPQKHNSNFLTEQSRLQGTYIHNYIYTVCWHAGGGIVCGNYAQPHCGIRVLQLNLWCSGGAYSRCLHLGLDSLHCAEFAIVWCLADSCASSSGVWCQRHR